MLQPQTPVVETPQPLAHIKAPTLIQELRQYAAEPLASEQAAIIASGKARLCWITAGASLGLAFTIALKSPQHRLLIGYVGSSAAAALATSAALEGSKAKAHHGIATTLTTTRPPRAIASIWLKTEARQLKGFDQLVSQHLFAQWVQEHPALTIAAQTVTDSPALPVAQDLGQKPGSALIGGVPGAGKGITYLQALAHLKREHPETQVMLINPKASGGETGTAKAPALVLSKDFANDGTPDELAAWLWDCIEQFKRWEGPKLLIIDEMASVMATLKLASRGLQILPKFRAFLSHITSRGDSERHWLWLISQDCSTDGLGISAALRATLRAVGIVSPKNRQALQAFLSGGWLPVPDGGKAELEKIMEASPVGRAIFDGKQGRWLPMQRLENLTGWDRDTGKPVTLKNLPSSISPQSDSANFWDRPPLPQESDPQGTNFPLGEAIAPLPLELDYFDIWQEWLHNCPDGKCTVRKAQQSAPKRVRTDAAGTREAFKQLQRMHFGWFDEEANCFITAKPPAPD